MKIIIPLLCCLVGFVMADKEHFRNLMDESLKWGPYRQNLIHGMRMKETVNSGVGERAVLTGLAWYFVEDYKGWRDIRVGSTFSPGLESFGYVEHDGRYYSRQEIKDTAAGNIPLLLEVETLANGGNQSTAKGVDWIVKVKGKTRAKVALVYFIVLSDDDHNGNRNDDKAVCFDPDNENAIILVQNKVASAKMQLRIHDRLGKEPVLKDSEKKYFSDDDVNLRRRVSIKAPGEYSWKHQDVLTFLIRQHGHQILKDINEKHPQTQPKEPGKAPVRIHPSPSHVMILPEDPYLCKDKDGDGSVNFHAFQRVYEGDFEFDITFNDHHSSSSSSLFDDALKQASRAFQGRFDRVFPVSEKKHRSFAQYALSNMLGGIGYFYGSAMERIGNKTQETKPYGMFSDTPCKAMFPRAFLWDSGFHHLIISRWDDHLSLEILENWYNSMNTEGWIAREQILGNEARSRVSTCYIVVRRKIQGYIYRFRQSLLLSFVNMPIHQPCFFPSGPC